MAADAYGQDCEYLFDQRYRDTFLVNSIVAFRQAPRLLRPLLFIIGGTLKEQPIRECNEKMVLLHKLIAENESHILLVAGQTDYGAKDIKTHTLRTEAARRLLMGEKILQRSHPHLTFKITDSFRPLSLQKQYFDTITAQFVAQGLTGKKLYNKTTQVIADPTDHPPHSTGGTVDLVLYDWQEERDLDMGSILDDINNSLARTFHPDVVSEARHNRLLLYAAMTEAGFVNSPSEWWHYSYGDREWAVRTDAPYALYDSVG